MASEIQYWTPTPFEIPRGFKNKTRTFGIGRAAAKKLAAQLNCDSLKARIVVYGCAGALDHRLKPGETFQVTHLHDAEDAHVFYIAADASPDSLAVQPAYRLVTSPIVVKGSNAKAALFKSSSAPIVDMEMYTLWQHANESVRQRLIFVRGVIDELDADLSFLNADSSIHWPALISFKGVRSLIGFLRCLSSYKRGMREFLLRLESDLSAAKAA